MNLREINFSFGGLHCLRDFGMIYAEINGHPITPPVTPNLYRIAGMSGNLRMPGKTRGLMQFRGNMFYMSDPPDQTAAQEMLRRVAAWLLGGRQRLVFDYEPHRFYLAEVNAETRWNFANWIEGGLVVGFDAQPDAYNVRENTVTLNTTDTDANLNLVVDTGEPAPLRLVIENTGVAPINAATVAVACKSAALDGMELETGAALAMDMEPPIGAVFSTGADAMPYAKRFDYITLGAGANAIAVTLEYGEGTAGAKITASARGRI